MEGDAGETFQNDFATNYRVSMKDIRLAKDLVAVYRGGPVDFNLHREFQMAPSNA